MKKILILGATSDIGRAIAEIFAKNSYRLQLAARNIKKMESLKKDLSIRYEVPVELYEFDASNYTSHQSFYSNIAEKPDVVMCVFGYLGNHELANKDWGEAQNIISTNFTGAVSILNIIAMDFEKRKSGSIVGISSVAGERGRQSNYIYGSAKAGFSAYLSGLRNRLEKSSVHVVTVKPGFVDTKMTEGLDLPKPLTAKPAQVAKAIFRAVHKKKNTIYVLPVWRPIMYAIKSIPESVFKKLKM